MSSVLAATGMTVRGGWWRFPWAAWLTGASLLTRIRSVFLLFALLNVLGGVVVLVFVSTKDLPPRAFGLLALAFLGWWWVRGHARGRFPLIGDYLEGAALLAAAVAAGGPAPLLGLLYLGLQFRSLYGGVRGVLLRGVIYEAAYGAALTLTGTPSGGDAVNFFGLAQTAVAMGLLGFALRTQEREQATLSAVMASLDDGLILTDEHGLVRYANPRVGELIGAQGGVLIGRPADAIFEQIRPLLAEPEAAHLAHQRAVINLEGRPSFEVRISGSPPHDVVVQYLPVANASNGRLGYGILLRDVTRERSLARAKDELVANVSHELRTPMAALVGFAELLLVRDVTEARRQEYLGIMVREGQRLTELLNGFLDLQRLESGQLEVLATEIDLASLLHQAAAAAGTDVKQRLVLQVPKDLPVVLAHGDSVQQVLANLLSNARKYSPGGGEIRLSARAVGNTAEVAVQDRGLGIAADELPHLFEKFYRVTSADRRVIQGTGLGLAICRRLVEAQGGRISAESPGPGLGSTFRFTLPLARQGAASGHAMAALERSSSRR